MSGCCTNTFNILCYSFVVLNLHLSNGSTLTYGDTNSKSNASDYSSTDDEGIYSRMKLTSLSPYS
jgi:hypothetical protein